MKFKDLKPGQQFRFTEKPTGNGLFTCLENNSKHIVYEMENSAYPPAGIDAEYTEFLNRDVELVNDPHKKQYYWMSLSRHFENAEVNRTTFGDVVMDIHPFVYKWNLERAYPNETHTLISWKEITVTEFMLYENEWKKEV